MATSDSALNWVFDMIATERQRQAELGWTAAHDDGHGCQSWTALLAQRLGSVARESWQEDRSFREWRDDYKRAVVQLAAIATACLESIERDE